MRTVYCLSTFGQHLACAGRFLLLLRVSAGLCKMMGLGKGEKDFLHSVNSVIYSFKMRYVFHGRLKKNVLKSHLKTRKRTIKKSFTTISKPLTQTVHTLATRDSSDSQNTPP